MTIFLAALAFSHFGIQTATPVSPWEREVVYQIFPRSFRDSNGDKIGDLNGIREKLDHFKRLGVTSLLINPIFSSRMYHNYFADDFYKVDAEYGTNKEFFDLIRAAHRKGLKVILDMEVQYVAYQHPWYVARAKDPASPFASYLWDDKGFYTSVPLPMYDGSKIAAAAVDPLNPQVRDYMLNVFRYWAAPEGKKSDGVDGFRIDHMMDDLDLQGVKKGMLANFWTPIETEIRRMKPGTFFLGEQSDWKTGKDLFDQGAVDAVYAMPLMGAVSTRDRTKIENAIQEELGTTPPGKTQLLFIENHDVERWATREKQNPALLRQGAVFNLTLKGTPLVYYGQELGMTGTPGKWGNDGNDIPMRRAYRWTKSNTGTGMAEWYQGGPWAEDPASPELEGVSVEEQDRDPRSLMTFYRRLIALRKSDAPLREGTLRIVDLGNPSVLAFAREKGKDTTLVLINLQERVTTLALPSTMRFKSDLWADARVLDGDPGAMVEVGSYGFRILRVIANPKP
ncbi:alpha-amylase family glycosyl hydrolase [Fimbriimonas ginsengisoli]|uniref:Alpha amylase, catalytic region n=1 Tax=Fimbriimonas ginsengisoli Gsoil 348 TaxID=661478 RepID=A0A068NKP8_FIMGI|nr:alpha-amylase family glycosyl hydrolase [Fimbriimonas ginsengisoli]AIE84148.1 Alpha amylase, catalytic region [Fimbriimonas ginsengisoli Gsoil 348]